MGTPAKERQKAYLRRVEELGFKRVNLMVPAERHKEICAIARQMCDDDRDRQSTAPLQKRHRNVLENECQEIASFESAVNDQDGDIQKEPGERRVCDYQYAAPAEQADCRSTGGRKFRRAALFLLAGLLGHLTGASLSALWRGKIRRL